VPTAPRDWQYPAAHDLKRLYDLIPKADRDRVLFHWAEMHRTHPELEKQNRLVEAKTGFAIPRDLPTILRNCSRAFEVIRYIYEHPGGTTFVNMEHVPEVLRMAIIDLRPDWESWSSPLQPN
jgi:hypothetical protein